MQKNETYTRLNHWNDIPHFWRPVKWSKQAQRTCFVQRELFLINNTCWGMWEGGVPRGGSIYNFKDPINWASPEISLPKRTCLRLLMLEKVQYGPGITLTIAWLRSCIKVGSTCRGEGTSPVIKMQHGDLIDLLWYERSFSGNGFVYQYDSMSLCL